MESETQLNDGTRSLVAQCSAVPMICNEADFRKAGELLKLVASFVKEIKAYFSPLKKQAQKLHKEIVEKEAAALNEAETAGNRLREMVAKYQEQIEREARQERERIEAEQRAERERIEAEIASKKMSLVEQTEALEKLEAKQERQLEVQTPAPPKVQGVFSRRIPDMEKIEAHVKAHRDQNPIPGVYVWCEWKFTVANTKALPEEFTKLTTTVRS